ncbi:MAG: alpha/beta fold hydrolase, partial [Bacteroidetes bacterium]|nr:alpha/beta fold hydrolase [Bacteroidota bacterium]
MPIHTHIDYSPPRWLKNRKHLQTIYPTLLRPTPPLSYLRERIPTPDGDFLDLDWSRVKGTKLVIVLHGLEGSADTKYVRGMIRAFNRRGWDGMGLNFRGCSGETNILPRAYHSGDTGDIDYVIQRINDHHHYEEIVLIGFSLGGNVTLKYLGEKGNQVPANLTRGVAFSVPCDLESCSYNLARFENFIYMQRFMKSLRQKVREKIHLMPEGIQVNQLRNFSQFDDAITAPLHGFENAVDYWTKSSSKQFIPGIRIPTLLVNAANDPFLTPECFPKEEAEQNPWFTLEVPGQGGHTGF